MANKTLYEILGVEPDSSQDDIKKAYRNLAKQTHPDLVRAATIGDVESSSAIGSQGAQEFVRVSEAFKVLQNPWSRSSYDESIGVSPVAGGIGGKFRTFDDDDNDNDKNGVNTGGDGVIFPKSQERVDVHHFRRQRVNFKSQAHRAAHIKSRAVKVRSSGYLGALVGAPVVLAVVWGAGFFALRE